MRPWQSLLILGLVGLLLCSAIADRLQGLAIDWRFSFRPAVYAYPDPYQCEFFNPPWALWLLAPFALLPPPFDHGVLMFVSAISIAFVAKKLGAKPWTMLLIFLSPPVLDSLLCGQLEWLVLLGVMLPLPVGLPLMLIKPQVGIVVAAWRIWMAYRRYVRNSSGGVGLKLTDFGLTIGVLIVSFVRHGFWPIHMLDVASQTFAWPYLLPLGGALVYKAWSDKSRKAALMAAPCLSPHAWPYSFSGMVVALAGDTKLLAVVVVGMWAAKLLC